MQINPRDNVEVDLKTGHKRALKAILKGEAIIKYGYPIGIARSDINVGEHVHTHNVKTSLDGKLDYNYEPNFNPLEPIETQTILAYARENGDIGIRNEIWIIPTVGCVNRTAEKLAQLTGAKAITHPYGCSQLGQDHAITQTILKRLVEHPNAAAVLVIGLGCENNTVDSFKALLEPYNPQRIQFLVAQKSQDEIADGLVLLAKLKTYADSFKRSPQPISKLRVGLKCGGSDGYSGITANPLVGRFSDHLIAQGGSTVLTEVPEMFGAETILMNRCVNHDVFDKTVHLINDFKDYFIRHGQVVYENPSPGNKEGGITTLEDKSLGCIQKGGMAPVVDVLHYGDKMTHHGLHLLDGPGNDIVSITNLAASGCHLILFTTGRGTPLGSVVPTIKVASNTSLAENKPNWIDYNAGDILLGKDLTLDFFDHVKAIVNGQETKNERNGYAEISIFRDGVTL